MSAPNTPSDKVVLIPAEIARRADETDRLNKILTDAGLGPVLQTVQPAKAGDSSQLVAVAVDGDPVAVAEALRPALPQVSTSNVLRPGVPQPTTHTTIFIGEGKEIGHAVLVGWDPTDEVDIDPWLTAAEVPGGRPVVALLDTKVENHEWFTSATATVDDPILVRPEWTGSASPRTPTDPEDLSHFGHGTFGAGLIRKHAPHAQILSLEVMDYGGVVVERNVAEALEHLVKRCEDGDRLDVVNMSFGREGVGDDKDSLRMAAAICVLAGLGVDVVIAAGNAGTDEIRFPAGLGRPLGPRVTSVGAGSDRAHHATFSSHGDWVEEWENGSDLISIMPASFEEHGPDLFVKWSGTSFSCAVHAAKLAAQREQTGARATA